MAEETQGLTEPLSEIPKKEVMSYRERPASPSEASVATIYDSILSSPPSPVDYGDDRLRNDLLDEICSDMGIHDSMDLDFYDFAYDNQDAFMMPADGPSVGQKQSQPSKPQQQQTFPSSCMQATNSSSNTASQTQASSVKSEPDDAKNESTQSQETQQQQETQENKQADVGHTVHHKPVDIQKMSVRRYESDPGYQSDLRSQSSRCSSATNYSTSAYGSSDSLNAIFHLTRSITSDGVNFNAYNNAKQNSPLDQQTCDVSSGKPADGLQQSCYQDGQMRKSVSFSLPSSQFPGGDYPPSVPLSPGTINASSNQGHFTFPPPLSHSNSAPNFGQQGYPQFGATPAHSHQQYQQTGCMDPSTSQYCHQQGNFHTSSMQRGNMSQDRQYRNSPSPSQLRQLGHYQKILPRPSQPSRVECGPYAVPSRSPYDRRRSDAEVPYMQSLGGAGEMMSSFDDHFGGSDDIQHASNMHTIHQGLQQNMQNYGRHLPYEPPPPPYPYVAPATQSYPQQSMEHFPQQQPVNQMPGLCEPHSMQGSMPTTPTQTNFPNPMVQQQHQQQQMQQRPPMMQQLQQNPGYGPQQQQQQQQRRPMFNPGGPNMMVPPTAPNSAEPSPQRMTALSQQNFMQRLVTDKSSAFRSHPLFPLLRDLVIADMNFEEPSFPFQLISNLPRDFNKLLQNYLARNPRRPNYQTNHAVESVITDALKYAHHSLIGKIQRKVVNSKMNSVQDFCDKFDQDVRRSMPNPILKQSKFKIPGGPGNSWGSSQKSCMQQSNHSMGENMSGDCSNPNIPVSGSMTPGGGMPWTNPSQPMTSPGFCQPMRPDNSMMSQFKSDVSSPCSQAAPDYAELKSMFQQQHSSFTDRQKHLQCMERPQKEVDSYVNNIPGGAQLVKTVLHNSQSSLTSSNSKVTDDPASDTASVQSEANSKAGPNGQQPAPQPKKHASLPKEAVAIMLDWLRAHMDKPYPNDDEKGMLIKQTGLSINQINYWFTNARRRVLPKWRGDDV